MEDLLNARIKPTDKKGMFSYLLKYQLIYRILIISYRYTYRIEKIERYPALLIGPIIKLIQDLMVIYILTKLSADWLKIVDDRE